ncbi:hypothetical protein B0I35DRAFT_11565 [Stachybotrys elegans]|uniref:Uncharacterized protein n=1 Tax=Stachybotrys elegans TaxID=80388 RepID=A0A8K0T526_9HYPO|nr:hypothetical protein B0I35DRAFT_11565 [Stachybotrys elegans]
MGLCPVRPVAGLVLLSLGSTEEAIVDKTLTTDLPYRIAWIAQHSRDIMFDSFRNGKSSTAGSAFVAVREGMFQTTVCETARKRTCLCPLLAVFPTWQRQATRLY